MNKYFLLLLLVPRLAFGAVAFDVSSTQTGASTNNITWSHTVTGANTLLICSAHVSQNFGNTISSFTYNGAALTSYASAASSDANYFVHMWYKIAPTSGTHTVSLAFTGSVENLVGACTSFSGANQTTPLGSPVTITGTDDVETAPLSVTVPTNGLGYDVVYFGNTGAACPGATKVNGGMTERFDTCVGVAGNNATGAGSTRTTSGFMSWFNIAGALATQIVVPISESAAPSGVARRRVVGVQ